MDARHDGTAAGHAPSPPASDLPARLRAALGGAYAVERELAGAGMSRVFVARELALGRRVVVKVLPPEAACDVSVERFRREIRFAARLRHAHVVPVLTAGVVPPDDADAPALPWYTMPLVEGETLRDRIEREGALPLPEAVALLREVTDAVAHAHRHGVVHRDLKPQNILLGDSHAHVTDFGVAKALRAAGAGASEDGDDAPTLTTAGTALGTPAYMAPEQAAGESVDAAADLYALGVIAYEMLAGRPPFVERSVRRLIAAHVGATPQNVARLRPDVPPPLAELVMRLLAKRAADRPPSAEAVLRALDALGPLPARPAHARGRPVARSRGARLAAGALAAAAVVAMATLAWRALAPRAAPLDPDRVVVFPLAASDAGLPDGIGEDVATLIGYALEGTAPLRWLDGSDDLGAAQRADVARVPAAERRRIARARRAAYYVDGRVVRRGDSASVVLLLHSVAGDSLVARRGRTGPLATPATELGLQAVGELLVPLLAPGRRVDLPALRGRSPAAIAAFLRGEREYRASRFAPALEHYRAALAADGQLALAALRGATAASWLDQSDEAAALARLSLAHAATLPPHRVALARGLLHYLVGAADSAVVELERAIAADSAWSEPWMALGEVYRHLLPSRPPRADLDSLAEEAFARARRLDTGLAPPLYHLTELAIGRGALARADTLAAAYARESPGGAYAPRLALMRDCLRNGPTAVARARAGGATTEDVLHAGALLAGGAAYPPCARAALWAALTAPDASDQQRWSALFALQSLVAATGRDAELVALFRSPVATAVRDADALLLLDAAAAPGAGPALRDAAAAVARRLGENDAALRPYLLWVLGTWEAERGRGDRVRTIARVLAARADSSRDRADAVRAAAVAARAALAGGDTALAIHRLRALAPSAPRNELFWFPWEALAGERLLLARLLLARQDHDGARRVAEPVVGSHAVVHLLHLRAALTLRAEAAAALGDTAAAARDRARLARLARDTAAVPWHVPTHDTRGSDR